MHNRPCYYGLAKLFLQISGILIVMFLSVVFIFPNVIIIIRFYVIEKTNCKIRKKNIENLDLYYVVT